MSKTALLLMAGSGASATSVGGLYILNKYGVFLEKFETNVSSEIPANSWLEFKKDGNGSDCVTQYFPGLSLQGQHRDISSANQNTVDKHYFDSKEQIKKFRSCLIINWDRKGPDSKVGNRWNGTFKWVWSFVKGNKGFVMFTLIKPSNTAYTLDMEGGVYVLENQSSDSWTVRGYKDLDGTKKINETTFEDLFPSVVDEQNVKSYWDFIKGKEDLRTICKFSEGEQCPTDSQMVREFNKGSWTWDKLEDEGDERWIKWSSNMDKWVEQLYPKVELDLLGALGTPSLKLAGLNSEED